MTTRTANYDRTALAVIVALSLAARTDALRAQAPTPGSGGAASRARAVRHSCTDRDFEGTFAVFGSGFILASPATGLIGPIARVGIFEADGAGHLKFRSRAAFNGIHFQQSFSGTYTMRPDCTFLSLVELPFSHPSIQPFVLPSTFLGILADQGREMTDIVMSPPGAVVYGRAR